MPSAIDPTKPRDGESARKADTRTNLAAIKAELEHGGFFLAQVGAVERRTQDKLREPGASAIDFGADPTGTGDSTPAIQAAIDAVGAAGGGTVYLPPGDYKIMIQQAWTSGDAALGIFHDNVTLQGAGMLATRLIYRGFGDVDPATVTKGQRGHGLKLWGTASPVAGRKNITLRDFQLDGGLDPTGLFTDFDSSHKGFVPEQNYGHDHILCERVWFRRFRGEMVWHGGEQTRRVTFRDCRLSEGNHNAFNIACGEFLATGCIVDTFHGGISEDAGVGNYRWELNSFNNVTPWTDTLGGGSGITCLALVNDTSYPEFRNMQFAVVGNQFYNCGKGVWAQAANVVVVGNTFIDCSVAVIAQSPPDVPNVDYNFDISGILVEGNVIKARGKNTAIGINAIGSNTAPFLSFNGLRIAGNLIVGVSPYHIQEGIKYRTTQTCQGVVIEDNQLVRCQSALVQQGTWPRSDARVPLVRGNRIEAGMLQTHEETPHFSQGYVDIVAGVADEPVYPPIAEVRPDAPFAELALTAAYYTKGLRLKLTGSATNAPARVPRRSTSFRCRTDRYLYPDTYLVVEFDGARFIEAEWIDRRPDAETTQTSGTALDAQGRDTVKLDFAGATILTAHQAVPEGVPITIYATNGNATLANNASIATAAGASLALIANRPYRFVRVGSVLRQMDHGPATVTTAGRPSAGAVSVGTELYDTTLSKPIYSDGTTWRDATGSPV